MPRNRALKDTSVHPRDTGSFVPYIDEFVKLLKPSETVTRTTDLLRSYLSYLSVRTDTGDVQNQARSGFRRKMKKLAVHYGITESSNPRGYFVEEPKLSRQLLILKTTEIPESSTPLFEIKFIDTKIGRGAFALFDIPANCKLTEYRGQWISKHEHESRDPYYVKQKLPPVAVFDKNRVLDANVNEEGNLFTKNENLGRYFNHSRRFPNCKLVREKNDRLFIVTIMNIPKGTHLKWDYGDRNILQHPWLAT